MREVVCVCVLQLCNSVGEQKRGVNITKKDRGVMFWVFHSIVFASKIIEGGTVRGFDFDQGNANAKSDSGIASHPAKRC